MHYRNGREAKVGDKVVSLTYGLVGIYITSISKLILAMLD